MAELEIRNLHVRTEEREILRGVDLVVAPRRAARADGPQRLRQVDAREHDHGPPDYEVTEGEILFDGENITELAPHERAQARPVPRLPVPGRDPRRVGRELPAHGDQRPARGADRGQGVPRRSSRTPSSCSTSTARSPRATSTTASPAARRSAPRCCRWRCSSREIAVLDETDSGLDIDALRTVAEGVAEAPRRAGPRRADHHPLPAHPPLRQAGVRAHPDGRADRDGGRRRARRAPRARGLRPDPRGGRARVPEAGAVKPGAPPRGDAQPRARTAPAPAAAPLAQLRERRAGRVRRARAAALASLGLLDDRLEGLDLDALADSAPSRRRTRRAGRSFGGRCPSVRAPGARAARRLGRARRARRGAARARRDPVLARAGRVREHTELFEPATPGACRSTATSSRRRARRSGPAARSSTCRRASSSRTRSRSSTRSSGRASRSTRTRSRSATPSSEIRLREYDLAEDSTGSRARRCTRASSSSTSRTARAAAWRTSRTGAAARCTTYRLAVVEVGRDAYCHWLPALLGGHLVRHHHELAVAGAGRRHGVPRAVLHRGARAPRRLRGRPARDRPVGRRRALARRGERREPRELRGADPDRPGRAADATPTCSSTR